MKSFRTLLPVLAILTALAGCSSETSSAPAAETANSQTALAPSDAEGGAGHRHGHPHGGPPSLVFAALHEDIHLTADQRTTIEGLATHKATAPRGDHGAALAAGIRAGKIDPSIMAAPAVLQVEHKNNLATLHKTLTPEQRAALVDAISARMAKGPGGDHGDMHRGHGPGGPGALMGHLLDGIDLTQEQRDAIHAKLEANKPSEADHEAMKAKFEAMKKEMNAKLQTFKADTFDAAAFVAPPAGEAQMSPAAHMTNQMQGIVSVLDASQREKLAQKIEKGPAAH
jgi:Spy/CpxP family protein refolding chaperone